MLLENVAGMASRHKLTLCKILEMIKEIKDPAASQAYDVQFRVMNSRDFGAVPQNRLRLYIVCIRRTARARGGTFKWPEMSPTPRLSSLLSGCKPAVSGWQPAARLALPSQAAARAKVLEAYRQVAEAGYDPTRDCIVVNCDARTMAWKVETTPCITSSRGANGGFWLSAIGSRLPIQTMARLQGMEYKHSAALTLAQHGFAIGNAFTQPVVARLFVRMLPASGLTPPLLDPWLTLCE